MCAAITGPTNGGIGCCGSPTAMLIAGLPGGMSPRSSRRRTNGERESCARTGEGEAWRVILYIIEQRGRPPHQRPRYHRSGEVKTRLTIYYTQFLSSTTEYAGLRVEPMKWGFLERSTCMTRAAVPCRLRAMCVQCACNVRANRFGQKVARASASADHRGKKPSEPPNAFASSQACGFPDTPAPSAAVHVPSK